MSREESHFVYIVQCSDDSLYTGYAKDVERRVAEHNGEGAADGARYTRGRRPVHLVYQEVFESRSAAQKREHEIKQLSKRDKLQLLKKSS